MKAEGCSCLISRLFVKTRLQAEQGAELRGEGLDVQVASVCELRINTFSLNSEGSAGITRSCMIHFVS